MKSVLFFWISCVVLAFCGITIFNTAITAIIMLVGVTVFSAATVIIYQLSEIRDYFKKGENRV